MDILPAFNSVGGVWVEITKSDHKHGGSGWVFGTCLWSPSRNRAGRDRYSIMRHPQKGDLVLHFYRDKWNGSTKDTKLCGRSFVAVPNRETHEEPPSPGDWGDMAPYYRIDLTGFTYFENPLSLSILIDTYGSEIRRVLLETKPRFFPFTTHGDMIRTVQGIYLAQCTPHLYSIFQNALRLEHDCTQQLKIANPHREYAEGIRQSREVYFFARNLRLIQAAKEHYGYKCQVCGFDFAFRYGNIGERYIECHHINPLSERSEKEWAEEMCTRIEDVRVLCSNCHRMVHRKKPPLKMEELGKCIDKK